MKSNQELWGILGEAFEVSAVAAANDGRKGNKRGTVVNGVNGAELRAGEAENVSNKDVDVFGAIAGKIFCSRDLGFEAELSEQLVDSNGAEFGAGNPAAFGNEPTDVEGLAAKRYEDTRTFFKREAIEMLNKGGIGFGLVKTDFVFFPTFVPEFVVRHIVRRE